MKVKKIVLNKTFFLKKVKQKTDFLSYLICTYNVGKTPVNKAYRNHSSVGIDSAKDYEGVPVGQVRWVGPQLREGWAGAPGASLRVEDVHLSRPK